MKRLFPKVAPEALGWPVDTGHWPSTVYIGAVPWIRRVVTTVPQQARRYAAAVQQSASDVLAESGTPFANLQAAEAGHFPRLDANYFHREHVQSERQCLLRDGAPSGARRELAERLQSIYDAGGAARCLGPPPTFYALLLADGDRLGRLVGKLDGASVSKALSTFTNQVPEIVRKHDGVTIYAGGDDVLAMLPVPPALECAASLVSAYTSAFPQDARSMATLSAAVVFAQIRLPLASVIDEAHRLLDEVAKDGNGRDSLASGVLKPGGLHCQWTTTWRRRSAAGDSEPAVVSLRRLVESLRVHVGEPGLSSALVYRIRHLLARLCDWHRGEPDHGTVRARNSAAGPGGLHHWRPGDWGAAPAGLDLRTFLRAEIGHSLAVNLDEGTDARADDLTDRVRKMLAPARSPGCRSVCSEDPPSAEVGVDALLLARFLASGGHEETVR